MKIAICQAFMPPSSQGGVGHFTDQLAERLVGASNDVVVFSLDNGPGSATYRMVRPDRTFEGRLARTYGFGFWLAKQRFAHFDIVHAMGDSHFLQPRVPVVRTMFGSALEEAIHARRLSTRLMYLSIYPLERLASRRASRTVAISESTKRHFPGVDAIIPPGVDSTIFHPTRKSPYPSVLAVGHRLNDRKRLFLVVDAFRRFVPPRFPTARLELVCDEPVSGAGITCHRSLPRAELAALFAESWVFCMPSAYEGFGIPYVEAMASGTAVVTTPNRGADEITESGRYGALTDEAELPRTICDLLDDEDRRGALEEMGLQRAKNYDWGVVLGQYLDIYSDLVT